MENDNKHLLLREVIIDHIRNSELKNYIKYKEIEVINPENIDRDLKISGRVSKNKEIQLNEFKEELYDKISDVIGNEEATEILGNIIDLELGLAQGDKFSGLDVVDFDGKSVKLSHEAGKVLMIDFWATWCGYCQEPMQENVELVTKNQKLSENNISIVGLSCDEDTNKWKNHIVQRNWTAIPQYVKKGLLKEVGVKGIPCIAIINKHGIISFLGHPSEINLEEALLNLAHDKPINSENSQNDLNSWWNGTDPSSKSVIVAESNFILKEAGVLNAIFCVSTRSEYDVQSDQMKAKKITPIFYGEVTPFEYETVQNCAITLQSNYNFNDFAFKMKVIDMSGNEDF
jgi:thiol-disulfide isomerase/thioredoxin